MNRGIRFCTHVFCVLVFGFTLVVVLVVGEVGGVVDRSGFIAFYIIEVFVVWLMLRVLWEMFDMLVVGR